VSLFVSIKPKLSQDPGRCRRPLANLNPKKPSRTHCARRQKV